MRYLKTGLIAFFALCVSAGPVSADEAALMGMIQEMQAQMKQMQKIIVDQNEKLAQIEKRVPRIEMADPGPGEVRAGTKSMSDEEFKKRLNSAMGDATKWLKGLKFGGDLRLRYEGIYNHGANPDDDRNRFRFRLRYGFDKIFNDQMKIGFAFATGENVSGNGHNGDPVSANQTFGNLWNGKNIWINKAYASYAPKWAKVGPVEGLEITAGKYLNPFERAASDMVFDRGIRPEGIYETANLKLWESRDVKVEGFVTAGQFVLQESATVGKDAEMFGFQAGINPVVATPFFEKPVNVLNAVSYYNYSNYSRNQNWYVDQSPAGVAWNKNNSVCNASDLCDDFRIIEYYGEVGIMAQGIQIRPFTDVTHNNPSGRSMLDRDAWSFGVKVGKAVKKGDWEASYQYKWIGADALPAFNDTDFGYRGYGGSRGNVAKLGYKITDDMMVNFSGFFVRNLNIASRINNLSTSSINSEIQSRFQVDLLWKF